MSSEKEEMLLKLDEYAKKLGITLYTIEFGLIKDPKNYTYRIYDFNLCPKSKERFAEAISFVECLKSGNTRN